MLRVKHFTKTFNLTQTFTRISLPVSSKIFETLLDEQFTREIRKSPRVWGFLIEPFTRDFFDHLLEDFATSADWHEQHFCGLQQAFGPWRFSWKFHSWNFQSQKSTLDRIDICAKISFRNHRKLFIAFSKRQNCFLELQELSF